MTEDSISIGLESKFEVETFSRTIQECNDIQTLRDIAIELLKMHQQKTAIAKWATKKAAEAELCRISSK